MDFSFNIDEQLEDQDEPDPVEINLDMLLDDNNSPNNMDNRITQIEIDLLDSIIDVKSKNSGSLKVIRDSMIAALNVLSKHFNIPQNSNQLCKKIINNDYRLKQRRLGNIRKRVARSNQGNVYYYSIQDILNKYVTTPIVLEQLIKEKRKRRDGTIIRSVLDLDRIR